MRLLIAIPALNEEKSIESIIRRSLEAVPYLKEHPPVTNVEVTVVSDGSTDRTVELAQSYVPRVKLIVFAKNRGYGAAIKEAWRQSDAELLGFLDADGTCEPRFFADLCTTLDREKADVALGCRLHAGSRMPLIRRIGNVMFAVLLTLFSSKRVRDTASGMRVVRRSALPKLLPLPDGLHFTPAMSARAILGDDVRIVEIDMPYSEREGESKLRVGKDGLRFLRVIMNTAFLYRPSRPLGVAGLMCFGLGFALMVNPIVYYLQHHAVLEWMIYRFIVGELLALCGCLLVCASYLATKLVSISLAIPPPNRRSQALLERFFGYPLFPAVPALLALVGGSLVAHSFLELVTTGATYEHWSRFVAMSALVSLALVLAVTRILDFILDLLRERLEYQRTTGAAARD